MASLGVEGGEGRRDTRGGQWKGGKGARVGADVC